MLTVTVEQFLEFNPCYEEEKIREIAGSKKEWSALDILDLDIPVEDRLWAVLRKELIEAPILHEFACRCAEDALKLIDNPDPRSIAAIAAKRKWLKGEITNEELDAARDAARAAASATAWAAARDAASATAWAAARDAASATAWAAASATAWAAASATAWAKQIDMLKGLI